VHKETDLRAPATVDIVVEDAMEEATMLNGRPEARDDGSVDEEKGVFDDDDDADDDANAIGMSLVDLLVDEEVIDAELLMLDKSYSIIMAENCCCCCCRW